MELCTGTKADYRVFYKILLEKVAWLQAQGIDQWPISYIKNHCGIRTKAPYIKRGEFLCIKIDGRVVAGCVLTPVDVYKKWSDGGRTDCMYIMALASAKKGAGCYLIKKIIEICHAKGTMFLRLDCRDSNTALKDYYLEQGFTYIGRIAHPFMIGKFNALFEMPIHGKVNT